MSERPKKKISADADCAFAVYELPPGWQPTPEETNRLIAQFEAEFGLKVALVPHGGDIHVAHVAGVYHRERLGEYEIEVVAKDEEDLKRRLEKVSPTPLPMRGE